MKSISTTYLCNYDSREKPNGNTYQTNIKGPKMILVPKVKI